MKQGDNVCWTTDTRLASALFAIGIPPYEDSPFEHLEKDGKSWVQWNFLPQSEDGKYETRQLMNAWGNEEAWYLENPEHPFSFSMKSLKIREYLIDGIKQNNPKVIIKNKQGTWYVPKDGDFHRRLAS